MNFGVFLTGSDKWAYLFLPCRCAIQRGLARYISETVRRTAPALI